MTALNPPILLTESETLQETIDCLIQHIPLETQGAFNASDLYRILVRAASNCDSIENTSKILKNATGGKNIRYHLDKINNFEELETNINSALKSRKLPGIAQKKLKLAIDLNLIPYYGNPTPEELPYIYRSQAKSGTCSFYAYATLYVIKKGKRLTLAIRGIRNRDTNVAIITYLLDALSSLKVDIKTLYLDRGFFSIPVIRWLKALRIPFIMPAIKTGKTGGIKQFLQGRKSYKTKTISLGYIHTDYRRRFGIESSYRIKNICRIKTTNKKPVIRLLFIGISFLLVNIWVKMLSFLRQAIDRLYQVVDTIYFPSG